MRGWLTILATLAAAHTALAGPGVAVEADDPEPSRLVVGAHAGAGRIVVEADGSNSIGYGPLFDVEVGARIRPGISALVFGAYSRDSATYNDPTSGSPIHNTYTHVLVGVRGQLELTPLFWVGVGAGYMHESDAFDRVHTNMPDVTGTDTTSSPALELRGGLDAFTLGHVRLQVIATGIAFQPVVHGFVSTIATLSVGAQWR